MKKYVFSIVIAVTSFFTVMAQESAENNSVKFYLSPATIRSQNTALSNPDRLYIKMTQLINQTGIAEVGYSTFLISPKLDVESVSSSNAGIEKIFLAECNLSLLVIRTSIGQSGEAVFNSFSKRIVGSGSSKEEAISNALTNISPTDKTIVDFFNQTKQKISDYFKAHCGDVIKEAQRSLGLKDYEGAIALYFSVPSNAPCYAAAVDASQKVYSMYVKDMCEKRLVRLRAYVALAQSENTSQTNYYNLALNVMDSLNPASDKCFAEAKTEIEKIEKRLAAEEKNKWEFLKKYYADDAAIKKEQYKAMQRINSGYQPAATNVIIAH